MEETDRERRTLEAMGEAMHAMARRANERGEEIDGCPSSGMEAMEKRMRVIEALSRDERAILKELCSFFDCDREKGDEKEEVPRAKEIIEELQLNVDFAALPYGETFLSGAVDHSLDMVKMLILKNADVNMENEMMSECALDKLLEDEEQGGLSDEKKAMKKLLLAAGAKSAEERWREMAEAIRKGGDDDDDDGDDSTVDMVEAADSDDCESEEGEGETEGFGFDGETLLGLMQNDPRFTGVEMTASGEENDPRLIDWKLRGDSIAKNTHLKYFYVEGELVDDEEDDANRENAEAFYRAISANRSITHLRMNDSFIRMEKMLDILLPFFHNNRNSIRSFGVSDFEMDSASHRLLVTALSSCNKKALRDLVLQCNYDEVADADDSASKLIDEVATHCNLKKLHLSQFGSNGNRWCASLANLLQNPLSKLEELCLEGAGINNGLTVLGNVIPNNTVLKKLYLGENEEISPTAWAIFFSRLVNSHSSLGELHVDFSCIDDQGAAELANFLVNNCTLKMLHFCNIETITSDGWVAFFNTLHTSSRVALEKLHLYGNGNSIEDDAAVAAMVNALISMPSLKVLDVRNSTGGLSLNGGRAMASLLRYPNLGLENLDFLLAAANDEVAAEFANALANNTSLKSLYFGNASGVTARGWGSFAHTLCNKSSMDNIYTSNHTLCSLSMTNIPLSRIERYLSTTMLGLNKNENKAEVARQKILRFYFTTKGNKNLQDFGDMKLKVLPQAVSWIGRDVTLHDEWLGKYVSGLSLMFRVIQRMPSLFDSEG